MGSKRMTFAQAFQGPSRTVKKTRTKVHGTYGPIQNTHCLLDDKKRSASKSPRLNAWQTSDPTVCGILCHYSGRRQQERLRKQQDEDLMLLMVPPRAVTSERCLQQKNVCLFTRLFVLRAASRRGDGGGGPPHLVYHQGIWYSSGKLS